MTLIWIGVAVLVAALALVFFRKASTPAKPVERPGDRRPARLPEAAVPRPVPAAGAASPTPLSAAIVPAAPPDTTTVPAVLADFVLVRAGDLSEERKRTYAAKFENVPRPPKLLHHLLSPAFVNTASSAQLVDLITGEPLIAAKVLTAVNSPMYGLKAPVSSIGQAVTYLGLNTVRGLCLQYILIASFRADSPERKRMLDAAWTSSALASELVQQLSQRLGFEDRGALVSAVVLSFLGRLATTASMSREELAATATHGLLDRTIAEQKALGLCASQIGRLLMDEWGLPASIVEDAADIDTVMVMPASAFTAERGSRLALCFVAARLGERLAEGTLADLFTFDPLAGDDPELFHLRGYLAHPALARLVQAIQSPEIDASLRPMRSAGPG